MTDQELTRLAAEKVMGWEIVKRISGGIMFAPADRCQIFPDDWQPLNDWRAAGEIVEKMRADGWYYRILGANYDYQLCHFFRGDNDWHCDNPGSETGFMPRAITIAALCAVGAIGEDGAKP